MCHRGSVASPLDEHPDARLDRPVVLLRVKAIPNARSSGLAGILGDRLKVKVNAPPEDGKANRAICELIAQETGLRASDVTVERGQTDAEKTLRLEGIGPAAARLKLGLPEAAG